MTYAWLRVHPEAMVGDAKVRLLSPAEKWYLILAWQAARNGPVYGELRNADGSLMDGRTFGLIADMPPRKASDFLVKLLSIGLGVPAVDGAVTFPRLRSLQGDDPTNATRQKRHRNAKSNGESNGGVTPQTLDKRVKPSSSTPSSERGPIEIDEQTDKSLLLLLNAMGEHEHSQAHLELLSHRARGSSEFDFRTVARAITKARPANPRAYVATALSNRITERTTA